MSVSFYPGPSRVEDKIPAYVKDAFKEGILSMNHRSPEFVAICKTTVGLLKQKLSIPKDYTIFFTSSATECWEILAQSLVTKESIHLYNGAFGEKWFTYTQKLHPHSTRIEYDQEIIPEIDSMVFKSGEMICLTQNETSNGTQLPNSFIKGVQKNNPKHLIAVDATSSMAGIRLDFAAADIWLASVQKCFGMPAGLGLIVASPKAIQKIRVVNETQHYNSLTLMDQMMLSWQTSFTPNVMAIYLLMRIMRDRPSIAEVNKQTVKRYQAWKEFIDHSAELRFLVENQKVRSHTVITIAASEAFMGTLKSKARAKGFLIGEGYGALKKSTFRLANFPALKEKEIKGLMKVLKRF
jgi:phosphoserine aminotransferase